jgi:hypothetical protein
MTGMYEDPYQQIEHLSRVVEIAEEDLGKDFFEENKGYFWGMLETRPYMRARLYLAQALAEVGKTDEAISHLEAMLELNPGDNQGNRYGLMGLYLEAGDLAGVRRLFGEYDGDNAIFTWSRVLERFLSGDTGGAEQALDEARKSNPYVEKYLLGLKPMPTVMPEYYGRGDENEAIMCFDTTGRAWRKQREALSWLRSRAPQQAPVTKVGRNDPCPCGSGKKYKKCCLLREQAAPQVAVSGTVAAEQSLVELHEAIGDRTFSSMEEAQAFLEDYNMKRNQSPVDDFQGLSPDQMHRLIHSPFDSPEVVSFRSDFEEAPSTPILTLFGMLVDAIGENGLKPTATGNLPLKMVRESALAYWGEEQYQKVTEYGSIRTELDFSDLHTTRMIAELGGLVRKYKGKFILSRECRKILKDQGLSGTYLPLMQAAARKFNWAYLDSYPDLSFVQDSFFFTLYLLHKFGDEWRTNTFYEDAYLRAFPRMIDEAPSTSYRTAEDTVRSCYSLRALQRFAEITGLIEIKESGRSYQDFELRKLPFLDQAVQFYVEQAG